MITLERECLAPAFPGLIAQRQVLLDSHEVSRKLRRRQLCPDPFPRCFPLFLEGVVHHQLHRLVAGDAIDMHRLVENRIGDGSQVPLQLNQLHERVGAAKSLLDHQALRVDGPSLHERTRRQHRTKRGVVAVGVHQLHVVSGHGLMRDQIVDGPEVVFAQERVGLGVRPVIGNGRHREKRLLALIERPGRVAKGERDPTLELRHGNDRQRIFVHSHEVRVAHEGISPFEFGTHDIEQRTPLRSLRVSQLESSGDAILLLIRSRSLR